MTKRKASKRTFESHKRILQSDGNVKCFVVGEKLCNVIYPLRVMRYFLSIFFALEHDLHIFKLHAIYSIRICRVLVYSP